MDPNPAPHAVDEIPHQSFFSQHKTILIILGLALVIILLSVAVLLFTRPKTKPSQISGTFNYTALKPDPEDRGEVQVKYRKYGTADPFAIATIATSLYAKSWTWDAAVAGQPYELSADLVVDGKLVTSSESLIVTAPAYNQILNLRVTWHDLPESVVREQTTSIQGAVSINGYIPNDAQLLVQAKTDANAYQTVVTFPNPKTQNSWNWEKTIPLKDYVMRAVLMEQNNQIGETQTMTAAGGDSAIDFTINSTAFLPVPTPAKSQQTPAAPKPSVRTATPTPTPLPAQGTISGTVMINGPEKENTSLLMLWRNPGDKEYKVITRINNPSHNGQAWSWTGQKVGNKFDITAVLQVNQQNAASSQSQIITAPAQHVNFTLNTGVMIPTPDGKVTVTACNSLGNNQYNAVLSFPRQSNAGNYWIQVGRSAAGSDVYNSKMPETGANPQITVQIDGNRSYYSQYAYSLCSHCSDDQNFSNFSQSTAFSCGGGTIYTGYVCASNYSCQQTTEANPPYAFTNSGLALCQRDCHPSPTPTATPTPIPTATPTPTPKIAYCNQSCGSNGYTCDDGLTCMDPSGAIGSSVCRNPNCTDEESCTCLPQ